MIQSAYIHIPFCKKICSYCDFCKQFYREESVFCYLKALKDEVSSVYQKEILKTLYLGGGTPSCLSISELEQLFLIVDSIPLADDYELTFECNVEDITFELLLFLKRHRVNRLSIGVQTFQEKYLSLLNRNHTVSMVQEKIEIAKACSFENINIDLMYAFPGETLRDVRRDLDLYLSLDVPHISMYSLILEEHTLLASQGVKPIAEEMDRLMYEEIETTLEKHGYHHYEVSNFAKEGYCSLHNLTYWNNEEYYGFGLGASGYVRGDRYTNTRSMNHYCEGKRILEQEKLSKEEMMSNEMILGLRKLEGVSKQKFVKKYHKQISEQYDIIDLLEDNLLEENEEYLWIARDKIYVSNQILLRFI